MAVRRTITALATSTILMLGISACGGTSNDAPSAPSASGETAEGDEVDVADDLNAAREAVAATLEADDSWKQIMLASDVDRPTEKYGMLVVPFIPSEAASRVQGTITIGDDGSYTIEADSAGTGDTWQIDQNGKITPAE